MHFSLAAHMVQEFLSQMWNLEQTLMGITFYKNILVTSIQTLMFTRFPLNSIVREFSSLWETEPNILYSSFLGPELNLIYSIHQDVQ